MVQLKCDSKGSSASEPKINGDGTSKSWLMHEVLHLVEDILLLSLYEGRMQCMSLLRNWDKINCIAAGRSCGLAV
jgi:hypothetical protein